ncbi:MAG: hypothetical protein Q7R94_03155 [bacterium]|nr:hypothetical protein [bacterium]
MKSYRIKRAILIFVLVYLAIGFISSVVADILWIVEDSNRDIEMYGYSWSDFYKDLWWTSFKAVINSVTWVMPSGGPPLNPRPSFGF